MSNTNTVHFKFEKDPMYRRIAVNGLWGGINPYGDLVFDLFEDVASYPEKITVVTTDGISTEERFPPKNDADYVTRIQHIGVTIPIAVVPGIIDWLQQKVQESNLRNDLE